MLPRRIILASLLAASVLASGCLKDAAITLGELQRVRSEINKKFGEDVNVHLGAGQTLTVTITFINSRLNDKTQPERGQRALETAQLVKANYPRIQSVAEIWVVFLRQKSYFFVFHTSNAFEVYGFDKDAQTLQSPHGPDLPSVVTPPETDDAPPLTERLTFASYSPSRNETDISIGPVALYGKPGVGLSVSPHFTLPGDATTKKGAPPKEVSFEFASFSSPPVFGESVPVAFIADGKPVLRTNGRFMGNEAQFCYLTVPYATFRKLVAAKTLKIKLGGNEYPFPPERFIALQQMAEHVKE
jgi:hypothetical protein